MSLSKSDINHLCDEIERVSALNAQGFIVRVYRVKEDKYEWVYGPLCFDRGDPIFINIDPSDELIKWAKLKAILLDAAI